MTEKISKKGKIFKVEKRYTIRYAYAGIRQYFDINEDKDGNLSYIRFAPQYAKISETPSVEHCKTVQEVLDTINPFCNNSACIHLINGQLPFYYEDKKTSKYIDGLADDLDIFIRKTSTKFFITIVLPILIKNDFKLSTSHVGAPILIKMYDGEYDNIQNNEDSELEYICYKFTSKLNIYRGGKPDLTPEHGSKLYLNGFGSLINYVDDDVINETGLRIEV